MNEDGDHRYMMFSATFNKECRELARKHLDIDHVRIRIGRVGSSHTNVVQQVRLFFSLQDLIHIHLSRILMSHLGYLC
jgi:superfamily II DNA/RNA helicase